MLLVQRIDFRTLVDQVGDYVRVIKHRSAMQRRHLLYVRAAETDPLLQWLHLKHQLNYFNSALCLIKIKRNYGKKTEREGDYRHAEDKIPL